MSTITFEQLALQIECVSDALVAIVSDAINQGVTARAWLTGYYIVEYEQHGEDRAQYGEQLLSKLSKRLQGKSFGLTNLKAYRKVYLTYTQLIEPVTSYLRSLMEQKSQTSDFLLPEKWDEMILDSRRKVRSAWIRKCLLNSVIVNLIWQTTIVQ